MANAQGAVIRIQSANSHRWLGNHKKVDKGRIRLVRRKGQAREFVSLLSAYRWLARYYRERVRAGVPALELFVSLGKVTQSADPGPGTRWDPSSK